MCSVRLQNFIDVRLVGHVCDIMWLPGNLSRRDPVYVDVRSCARSEAEKKKQPRERDTHYIYYYYYYYRGETESTAQKGRELRPLVLPVKAGWGRVEHWEVNEAK